MDAIKIKARQALQVVRKLAMTCKTATELHNAFFGNGGRFGQMFPKREERAAFFLTAEYREIFEIRNALEESELDAAPPSAER